jgi:hypothetical protein
MNPKGKNLTKHHPLEKTYMATILESLNSVGTISNGMMLLAKMNKNE